MTVLTNRTHAPFRYDIVGSFLRPAALKKARSDFAENKITIEQLTEIENICIRDLVKKEIAAGLHSVTDGEFRRSYWHLDFMWGFSGIEHTVLDHGYLFHGEETRADSARVIGKIRFANHPFLTHFRFLKQIAGDTVLCRQTIPGPAQFFSELVRGENEKYLNTVYPDREEACQDLIRAYHDFILALYEEGCRNLQLDDCTWGMLCDIKYWKNQSGGETNMQSLQELYLRLTNDSIADLPKDLIINTHVCRGNYHSTWATSGGYGPVGKILFGKENVTGYYLEFDDNRSGDFTPLQDVSDNKIVVLGLITSKKPKLENKAAIISRIKEASQFVPLDRLCLSPQCGFSSTEEGNILTEEEQWQKIALVKEIANEVWN
ncbi:MAG: 5-methyltetrahydropteroyltriglutamate--homocysteine S-methyltransferase [Megasphaera sp.]|jgi:methionine synthase II (cobalamin-independent)|nr:5-methyltetrahydropteroyltriglutamate--homocysteine S-methyltransferase [Megasphaera sp.]MCI1824003.1 5-methyltetrahydropteroyltriglutamate--homocysteine S-methyltransferase [Megasphaera sp.]